VQSGCTGSCLPLRARSPRWQEACTRRVVRLIDHPPRVLVARGELQGGELARAGLTDADVYALLRENGVGDLGQVGYLLYETRGRRDGDRRRPRTRGAAVIWSPNLGVLAVSAAGFLC
jgi:hypothetical protein